MAWQKINEKLYRISINDELTDIKTPYAVAEKIFVKFVTSGVGFDAEGKVEEVDPITAVSMFGALANILLTKYSPTGEVIEEGNYFSLSSTEISELFEISMDLLQSFTMTIAKVSAKKETAVVPESADEKTPKAKKTKD